MHVRVPVCARACMRACVHDVFSVYDNNILPRLIIIIIQMIIRYFIQITHTDDFLSKGTRLVTITCRKYRLFRNGANKGRK